MHFPIKWNFVDCRLLVKLGSRKVIQRKLSVEKRRGCSPISLLSVTEDLVLSNGRLYSHMPPTFNTCHLISISRMNLIWFLGKGLISCFWKFVVQGYCWNCEWILCKACRVPCGKHQTRTRWNSTGPCRWLNLFQWLWIFSLSYRWRNSILPFWWHKFNFMPVDVFFHGLVDLRLYVCAFFLNVIIDLKL